MLQYLITFCNQILHANVGAKKRRNYRANKSIMKTQIKYCWVTIWYRQLWLQSAQDLLLIFLLLLQRKHMRTILER